MLYNRSLYRFNESKWQSISLRLASIARGKFREFHPSHAGPCHDPDSVGHLRRPPLLQPSRRSARHALLRHAWHSNCLEGKFLDYWNTNGGLPVFGYPITGVANETNADTGKSYPTQWLERNRFELHAENAGTPYEVLLGLLGKERLAQVGRNWQAEPRESGPKDGCLWFEQTGHNVCNQSGNLGFKSYWESHGLKINGLDTYAQSLQLFGLPLTEPKMETNAAGDTVLTQWFERARFEWHPNEPDEYKVLLGLLGTEIKSAGSTPAPTPTPTPPPAGNPCDQVPAPVSARIRPGNCISVGTPLEFDFYGFNANEQVGFWLTSPEGIIIGTKQTGNIGPSGSVTLPFSTSDLWPGMWQFTMQGVSSGHQSIIYFLLLDSSGSAPAPKTCSNNLPAAQNGVMNPTCLKGSTNFTIDGYGFSNGEEIGFYITAPDQSVADLGPLSDGPLYADGNGNFRIYGRLNGALLDAGVYAITFEGKSSHHKTIVYFEGADN